MKLLTGALQMLLCACQHDESRDMDKKAHEAKLQALAKKYDIRLTITPNATQTEKLNRQYHWNRLRKSFRQ